MLKCIRILVCLYSIITLASMTTLLSMDTLPSTAAHAQEALPTITAKDLKAKMDSGEKLFLLNPLSDLEFNEGHIPGSINIPLHTMQSTDKLPQDKNALIVTYCLGPA